MVYHDIVRPHISVHNPPRMTKIKCLATHQQHDTTDVNHRPHFDQLKHVISHIEIRKSRVQDPKIHIMHIFHDQTRYPGSRIADEVQEGDDIRTAGKILEDLDLSFDLHLIDGLENLDGAFLFRDGVQSFEYLKRQPFQTRTD
jgi:hypothetical protein